MEQRAGGMTRKTLLRRGAAGAVGAYAAGGLVAWPAAASVERGGAVTLNWLTWSDHYFPKQLQSVKKAAGIGSRVSLISDNADTYVKLKRGGAQWDLASADALWLPKHFKEGLIESFDLDDFAVSKQLYPVARRVPFWKDGSNTMGYPFGWSSLQIFYNPKYVKTKPTSWHALVDPKYRGKVVVENQPTDLMAMAGIATGAKTPYNMRTGEISRAKEFLKKFKPNVLKLVSQNPEAVRAMADESAWLTIENLGTDARVRSAGGPRLAVASPKEGIYGWVDAEMLVKSSRNKDSFPTFLDRMMQASWIAKNFIEYGRPLFNEKAYKILVNGGHKERADRYFYNEPERPLKMTLKGPSENAQAYLDAFNEVFGG